MAKVQNLLLDYYDDYEMVARIYFFIALGTTGLDILSFFIVFGTMASFTAEERELSTEARE